MIGGKFKNFYETFIEVEQKLYKTLNAMFKKQDVELIKNQLAKLFDNYIEKVVAKTNLSRPTVSKFFNFQKVRPVNAAMIYDAGLELIQEQANQQQSRIKRARQLINGDGDDTPQTSLNI